MASLIETDSKRSELIVLDSVFLRCGIRPGGTTSFSLIQNASDTGNSGALSVRSPHLDGETVLIAGDAG
jgi:hypothetical protein